MADSQNAIPSGVVALDPSANPVTTRWVTGVQGLQSLRSDWESLHDSGGVFCCFELFEAYLRYLADAPSKVGFVVCSDVHGPLAIVPAALAIEVVRPFGRLHTLTLGTHLHLTVLDFPLSPRANPRAVGEAVILALKRTGLPWSVIRWRRCPAGGNAWRVMNALGVKAIVRPEAPSNGFKTTLSFEALRATWSKNLRVGLQKARKRLNEGEAWEVVSSRNRDDQERFFDEFLRLEASGWKGENGTGSAIAMNPAYRDFYRSLLHANSPGLDCEITLLKTGGCAIAAQFSMTAQRCKHILKIGYDEGAGRFSPGQILLEEVLMRACANENVDRVSLVTDMKWHRTWRAEAAENFEGLVFRRRAATLLYRICLASLRVARTLHKSFRPAPTISQ